MEQRSLGRSAVTPRALRRRHDSSGPAPPETFTTSRGPDGSGLQTRCGDVFGTQAVSHAGVPLDRAYELSARDREAVAGSEAIRHGLTRKSVGGPKGTRGAPGRNRQRSHSIDVMLRLPLRLLPMLLPALSRSGELICVSYPRAGLSHSVDPWVPPRSVAGSLAGGGIYVIDNDSRRV